MRTTCDPFASEANAEEPRIAKAEPMCVEETREIQIGEAEE
jgi:hypothetical protein